MKLLHFISLFLLLSFSFSLFADPKEFQGKRFDFSDSDSLKKLWQLKGKRFGIPLGDEISFWDLQNEYVVDPDRFLSKGRSTPFEGERLFGKCLATVFNGKIVYQSK